MDKSLWKSDKKAVALRSGEKDTIACTLNGENINVKWTIDANTVASVDKSGCVHGLSKGITAVCAHHDGKKVLEIPVYVDREVLPPLGTIPKPRFTLEDGVYVNPNSDAKTNTALLMFTGDVMCLSGQQKPAMKHGSFNFNASFDYVKPIFEKADLVACNLETMISQTATYKWEQSRVYAPKGLTTNCNAPATFLDAVRYAGFDATMTATNHCLDTGIHGIKETIENLDRYNLLHTGIFDVPGDERYLLVDVNGIKIAMLSYVATSINSWEFELPKELLDVHVNMYSIEKVKSDVDSAKRKGAEFIVVFVHWGPNNTPVINHGQHKKAQALADVGVDYVVGSHPHVIMNYSIVRAKDGRKVPVVYSMGNFLTSMDQVENKLNRDALILQLELEKSQDGELLVKNGYIPCFICKTFRKERFVVMPCNPEINGGYTSENIEKSRARIKKAIGCEIAEI